jgi:hypothetical protein
MPLLYFLVLHLIDDDLDVLDSSLNGISGFLESVLFCAGGSWRVKRKELKERGR